MANGDVCAIHRPGATETHLSRHQSYKSVGYWTRVEPDSHLVGRSQQAEQLYLRISTFVEQEFPADSPYQRVPLDKLITLMKSQGRLSEAAQYEARRNKLPEMPVLRGLTN